MNRKNIILLTLSFFILLPSMTFAFTDVEEHWAKDAIEQYANQGIINGYEDGTFLPDANMTRAELMTLIDQLLRLSSETDKYIPDVKSSDWYYSSIRSGIYFGILQGDESGKIHPNSFVTREEAILMLTRAFQLPVDEGVYTLPFADKQEIATWAQKEVTAFVREQYIQGYEDNTLRPKNHITRAEIVTLLGRIIKNMPGTMYMTKVTGLTLMREKNSSLDHVEIYGNLMIGEGVSQSIVLNNTIVHGNLVLFAPVDLKSIAVTGKIIKVYENNALSNLHFSDSTYGIRFSIPDGATAIAGNIEDKIDNTHQDFILVDIRKDEKYYLQSVTDISKEMIQLMSYDSIFRLKEKGKIHDYSYELYDDKATSQLLVIQRDDIVYTMLFFNLVSDNIVDSVLSNITFMEGSKVANHETMIYKNTKLSLKFNYKRGYVGVDDSYNTGNIYSGDAMFKLFIQVNMITDIDEYSINEVKYLLETLIKNDGTIVEESIKKINTHDAIQFEIESEEGKIISLYVIIGKNLYNFIFKGETAAIDSVGKEMFTNIVNSMEF